jgi:phage gpG-like protein
MENSGLTLTLNQAGFDATVARLLSGVKDFSQVTPEIAQILENSVRRNFREGGRPGRWPASKRADGDAGYGNASGQTLVDTSRLMNSIIGTGDAHAVKVGTNVEYAAAHNFGVDKEITQQVREHTRRITQAFGREIPLTEVKVAAHTREVHMKLPAREFMLIQDEDWGDVQDVITIKLSKLLQGS